MRITVRRAVSLVVAMALVGPAAAVLSTAVPAAAAGTFGESTLWDSTAVDQYASFHVQGLAVIRAATPVPATGGILAGDVVLTFTEGRYAVSDSGEKDLLMRRSVDGGRTWAASVAVVGADPTQTWGGPTPLVDNQTGAVFLFYNAGGSMFEKRSDDAGATWSATMDLTSLYATNPNGWVRQGPTPGHGLQLDSGRLLLPVGHRAPDPDPNYGDDALYSDDHGVTWKRSATIPFSVNYPIGESRVYQRSDGAVVINGRWGAGGTRYRITSTSTDGGATWSKPVIDGSTGQFVSVDAGMIQYSRGPVNRLLFSRPASSARENMTVSISYDEGASFRYSRVVNSGPSYYSDLAMLSDGTILLVYGRDGDLPNFPERISMARFDLEWLTNGRDSLANGPQLTLNTYELATAQARTDAGTAPQLVEDANARGGKTLRYAASAVGDYVETPFDVTAAGSYEVAVRHHRLTDGGDVRASIDGVDLAHGLVDPALAASEGYQVYQLGRVALAAGTHWIRFTLAGVGWAGGKVVAPDQLMLTTSGTPIDTPSVIADNDSVESFQMPSGTWNRATGVAGYYGQSYRTHAAGTGTAVARWRPDVPMTGVYQVAIWYTEADNRASNASFVVNHAGGRATFAVDQRTGGSRWVTLGSFSFVAGDAATIELSDDADGYVIADAVRLIRTGVVADNDAEATFDTVSGTWNKATGVAGYYGDSYRTHAAGTGTAVVRWRPDVPAAGLYTVAVWYTADTNRATNAPFLITYSGGQATVRINQQTKGSQWVSLGTFSFTAGDTGTIELSDNADGYAIADAVRLTLHGT
jgi:hypothetical protein